jgi:hypothetical protein
MYRVLHPGLISHPHKMFVVADKEPQDKEKQKKEKSQITPCRVLFCDGQDAFPSHADFAGVCVAPATLLLYSHPGWAMDGKDDIVSN